MTEASVAPPSAQQSTGGPTEMDDRVFDVSAIGRYIFAFLIQIILIGTAFGAIDLASYGPLPGNVELGGPLPWQAVVGVFFALSLRSRVFNPLDNSRPDSSRPDLRAVVPPEEDAALYTKIVESGGKKTKQKELMAECERRGILVDNTMDRIELERRFISYYEEEQALAASGVEERALLEPDWKPPGVVFPLMWVGVVAPLRAFSSSLVYEASTGRLNEGRLDDPVLLWLVVHLCLGDIWNTINNVEKRTGAAVVGVSTVFASTLFTAKQYYDVAPLAGMLLGLTAVWIGVAGVLVADTWRINNAVKAEPLYPYKRKGRASQTRLSFEE